jgi:hypothetical protein
VEKNQASGKQKDSRRRRRSISPKNFSYRKANLHLAEVEIKIVRVCLCCPSLATLEDCAIGHTSTEQLFKIGLDRNVILPISGVVSLP